MLSRPELRWQGNAPPAVVQVIHYIEEHYASPLHIPRLARMVDLCTEALARSFKRHQGITIGQFIVRVRVREAGRICCYKRPLLSTRLRKGPAFPTGPISVAYSKDLPGNPPPNFATGTRSMCPERETDDREVLIADVAVCATFTVWPSVNSLRSARMTSSSPVTFRQGSSIFILSTSTHVPSLMPAWTGVLTALPS